MLVDDGRPRDVRRQGGGRDRARSAPSTATRSPRRRRPKGSGLAFEHPVPGRPGGAGMQDLTPPRAGRASTRRCAGAAPRGRRPRAGGRARGGRRAMRSKVQEGGSCSTNSRSSAPAWRCTAVDARAVGRPARSRDVAPRAPPPHGPQDGRRRRQSAASRAAASVHAPPAARPPPRSSADARGLDLERRRAAPTARARRPATGSSRARRGWARIWTSPSPCSARSAERSVWRATSYSPDERLLAQRRTGCELAVEDACCASASARASTAGETREARRLAAPRSLDQAVADADRHGLRARGGLELGEDPLGVGAHRLGREAELLGDGVGLHAVGEHLEDLALAGAERAVALVEHDRRGEARVDVELAGAGGVDRADQVLGGRVLADVALDARLERLAQQARAAVGGEDDDRRAELAAAAGATTSPTSTPARQGSTITTSGAAPLVTSPSSSTDSASVIAPRRRPARAPRERPPGRPDGRRRSGSVGIPSRLLAIAGQHTSFSRCRTPARRIALRRPGHSLRAGARAAGLPARRPPATRDAGAGDLAGGAHAPSRIGPGARAGGDRRLGAGAACARSRGPPLAAALAGRPAQRPLVGLCALPRPRPPRAGPPPRLSLRRPRSRAREVAENSCVLVPWAPSLARRRFQSRAFRVEALRGARNASRDHSASNGRRRGQIG